MICQSDGTFLQSNGPFRCEPSVCGNLSDHAPFSSPRFLHTCEEKSFGQTCSVTCGTGWDLQGNATVMLCQTGGYVEALTSLPAESSLGPTCVPRECTAKLPSLRGVLHDCVGKTRCRAARWSLPWASLLRKAPTIPAACAAEPMESSKDPCAASRPPCAQLRPSVWGSAAPVRTRPSERSAGLIAWQAMQAARSPITAWRTAAWALCVWSLWRKKSSALPVPGA